VRRRIKSAALRRRTKLRRDGWERCIVAATGPSLTEQVAERCGSLQTQGFKIVAINDAWRRLPFADVLYTTDRGWWDVHGDIPFAGERWASQAMNLSIDDDKRSWGRCEELRINLVNAADGDTFSFVPGAIHYGNNSGFAGVNLALQFGAQEIRLVGFDMHRAGGLEHFFGDHPAPLHNGSAFAPFIRAFTNAAKALPAGVAIINCTPGSALHCFPFGTLNEIDHDRHRRAG
jgi:hypothetical protein